MKYLLDSNICIHFFRNKFDIYKKLEAVGLKNCAISEITLAELIVGAEKSKNPTKNYTINKKLYNYRNFCKATNYPSHFWNNPILR